MKLYYTPGVCSLSPHIALREAGLDFTLEKVDIASKNTETGGDYRKVNPNGYVPALEIEPGLLLTEGPAIVQYIADKAPASGLAPANGTLARYQLQSWLNFITSEIHKGFSPLFKPHMPAEAKSIFKDTLALRFDYLDQHLATRPYLTGEHFTIADGYLFVTLRWSGHVGIELERWPNLTAFKHRVQERPAVQAALRAEGLIK